MTIETVQNHVVEIDFQSASRYDDPYNDVELDMLVTTPAGQQLSVPGYWAGDNHWKVRFAGAQAGAFTYVTAANVDDDGLQAQAGTITIRPYEGDGLARHGRLRVAEDNRHFTHQDGTPFFWTGDTWWMGLTTRLDWPAGFAELTNDRVAKGFNVIQIIAGPLPDMDAWDERGRNEAGFPFAADFASINPAYYDHADRKIAHLVSAGLVPCIVGMWGFYLPIIGLERVKRYWRYLVARYGAYPVVWCICGEAVMPFYLSASPEEDAATQKQGWTEVMREVRNVDPFDNLITIHPTRSGRAQVEDPTLMDFEMLQSGHSDIAAVGQLIDEVPAAVDAEPLMPVIESEVNYEGILGRSFQNVQRLCFYHAAIRGAAGFTYGANGLWQMSTEADPYGLSPHGRSWGDASWQEAAQLPGSRQVGFGGAFMHRFPWWAFEPRPDWISDTEVDVVYCAVAVGIPGKLRVIYMPMVWTPCLVINIEPDIAYTAYWFDPLTGADVDIGPVEASEDGAWTAPIPPVCHDWLLVMTNSETGQLQ